MCGTVRYGAVRAVCSGTVRARIEPTTSSVAPRRGAVRGHAPIPGHAGLAESSGLATVQVGGTGDQHGLVQRGEGQMRLLAGLAGPARGTGEGVVFPTVREVFHQLVSAMQRTGFAFLPGARGRLVELGLWPGEAMLCPAADAIYMSRGGCSLPRRNNLHPSGGRHGRACAAGAAVVGDCGWDAAPCHGGAGAGEDSRGRTPAGPC
jgi:hypothetical protein